MLLRPNTLKATTKTLFAATVAIAVSACGGGSDNPLFNPTAANAYVLTSANRIVPFDLNDTQYARTGELLLLGALVSGEIAIDIDFRATDAFLYVLTRTSAGSANVLAISTQGTVVGKAPLEVNGVLIGLQMGVSYSVEINPVTNALSVIGSDGTHFTSANNFDIVTGYITNNLTPTALPMTQNTPLTGESLGLNATAISCTGNLIGLQNSKRVDVTSNTAVALSPALGVALSLDSSLTGNLSVALLGANSNQAQPYTVAANGTVTALPTLPALANGETYQEIALVVTPSLTPCSP